MKFEGVYTPVITPFNDDYSINEAAFADAIERQIEAGIHGIIVSGTTGESYAQTATERAACFRQAKAVVAGRTPLIGGIGATRTEDVVELGLAAKAAGADAVLLPAPAYVVPSQDELASHTLEVERAVGLPIMLYNYPARTGVMMGPEFLDRIGDNDNICAIKETSGDVNRLHMLAQKYSDRLQLSCGWDDQALEFFAAGARSWVAGAANVHPREHIALYEACVLENDLAKGRAIMAAMMPLFQLLDDSGKFIPVVKHACALEGLKAGAVRKPLTPLSAELEQLTSDICGELKRSVREILADSADASVHARHVHDLRTQTA